MTAATGTSLLAPKTPLEDAASAWEVLEAVIPPGSELVGKTAREVNLRYQFGLNLVGVARQGARIRTRISNTAFKGGDILLLQGGLPAFRRAAEELGLVQLATREVLSPARTRPLWLGLSVFVATLVAAATSLLPVEQAFVLRAFLMIALGALPAQQAYAVLDLPLLLLLACMLAMGKAMETSGAAASLAHTLVRVGSFPTEVFWRLS